MLLLYPVRSLGLEFFITAAIISLFYTPDQISETTISARPITTIPDRFPAPVEIISPQTQKLLESTHARVEEQTHRIENLVSRNAELSEELKKAKLSLEKEKDKNAPPRKPDSGIEGKGKDKGRGKPKPPPNDWLTPYVSKISKKGLTWGWLIDVINALNIYTVGLMLVRNIWDFFNPELQEDPDIKRKKLGQLARGASYRGSIKKASLREPVYQVPQTSDEFVDE